MTARADTPHRYQIDAAMDVILPVRTRSGNHGNPRAVADVGHFQSRHNDRVTTPRHKTN